MKIVENYKTSWNSSKLIDIYNIIVELDARDDILYPVGNELREIFSFLIVQPLSQYTGHHRNFPSLNILSEYILRVHIENMS